MNDSCNLPGATLRRGREVMVPVAGGLGLMPLRTYRRMRREQRRDTKRRISALRGKTDEESRHMRVNVYQSLLRLSDQDYAQFQRDYCPRPRNWTPRLIPRVYGIRNRRAPQSRRGPPSDEGDDPDPPTARPFLGGAA